MNEKRTLIFVIEHLRRMYGLRNCAHHDSRGDLLDILDYGLYELDQTIAGKTERTLNVCLASLFALAIAIMDDLTRAERSIGKSVSVLLVEVLSRKYPGFCLYCNQSGRCVCPETKRPKPDWKKRRVFSEHLERSLAEWQQVWKETYGEKNQKRGFEANISALGSEAREIRRIKILFAESHMRSHDILENYLEEIADFLARLSAVANLDEVKIDLESVVWQRYGSGCPKCRKTVCICAVHHSSVRDYYRTLSIRTRKV